MKKGLKILILSDLLIIMGFGLISPILAIFIKEDLFGGSAFAAGMAITVSLLTKSALQMFFGKIEDHHAKKKFLIYGTFLITLTPLGYFFAKTVMHMYFLQFIYGVGTAMAVPSYLVLFTSFMDRGKEAYEWGVYGTVVGFGTAITASLGGFIAERFSFELLFLITFFIGIFGTALLFWVPEKHFKQKKRVGSVSAKQQSL